MAASGMKSLAKDTAIYGMSSILGRIFNYLLVPLHLYIFSNPEEYGRISNIYGITAILLILLTYGMETGFFRFMNKEGENPGKVYSTSLITLGTTSLLFVLFCICFITPISELIRYPNKEHIMMMAFVVAADAFMAIPFAYLRHKQRPVRFMTLKLSFIGINILFNLIFLVILPWLNNNYPDFPLSKFYHPTIGIGYVFLANLIATLATLLLLIPSTMKDVKFQFDKALLRRMLIYSLPLLILGLAGVINQTVAQITYPFIFDDRAEADYMLGVYSASLKIAVIITMFTQAFRYAYEPFFFGKSKDKGNTKPYAEAMKYYIIFALLVFITVLFYLDIIKYLLELVGRNYVSGLKVLPVAMIGEILFGVYFNLSVWYKLTDKTKYGAYFSVFGCILQLAINIIFVPIYGYMASAWATLICNLLLVIISYGIGQKYFPVKYDLKTIFFYFALALAFSFAALFPQIDNEILRLGYRTIYLIIFIIILVKKDLPLSQIPFINKFFGKK